VASRVPKRRRAPRKREAWSRKPEDGLSVLRLPLDTSDPVQRARLEAVFWNTFQVKRALQRDVQTRLRAYRAARREREQDAVALRSRLKLRSRTEMEYRAYAHLDAAPHLRRRVTKALAMHVADSVWTPVERHLFPDASGKRQGIPGVSRWQDFTRIPGRARRHEEPRKWETWRLHGTLAGHRTAYTGTGGFFQPRRMRPVDEPKGSWWRHAGPLVVVFSGLAGADLVLPVRLPSASSNQAMLEHHLSDPSRWHKIDLVRSRDRRGRWRYEAHLMVLTQPFVSPSTRARRAAAAIATSERRAGIDVNVSNITIASVGDEHDLRVTRVERSAGQRQRSHRRARQERRRQRALERSRRAMNAQQYELSKRQAKRARRREAAGLRPVAEIPRGPRRARSDGKPLQSYRRDRLSKSFRRQRSAQVGRNASATRARRDHARDVAGAVVQEHGFRITMEACDLRVWSRRWGRSLAAFAPGTIVAAIQREADAVAAVARMAGGLVRASTRTTAMSQHCLCGERVAKDLGQRTHTCQTCGLHGARDTISAVLAAHVVFGDRREPESAVVDFDACRTLVDALPTKTIDYRLLMDRGRQDARSESTAYTARDGFSAVEPERTPDLVVVARRIAGTASLPTPTEPGAYQVTLERSRMRTSLFDGGATALQWDSS
jgi:transposase